MNFRIYSPWKKFTNIWTNEYICLNMFEYIGIFEYLSHTGTIQNFDLGVFFTGQTMHLQVYFWSEEGTGVNWRLTVLISEGAGRYDVISAYKRARELKLGSTWDRIKFPMDQSLKGKSLGAHALVLACQTQRMFLLPMLQKVTSALGVNCQSLFQSKLTQNNHN